MTRLRKVFFGGFTVSIKIVFATFYKLLCFIEVMQIALNSPSPHADCFKLITRYLIVLKLLYRDNKRQIPTFDRGVVSNSISPIVPPRSETLPVEQTWLAGVKNHWRWKSNFCMCKDRPQRYIQRQEAEQKKNRLQMFFQPANHNNNRVGRIHRPDNMQKWPVLWSWKRGAGNFQ